MDRDNKGKFAKGHKITGRPRTGKTVQCGICKKSFYVPNCLLKKDGSGKYCSARCRIESTRHPKELMSLDQRSWHVGRSGYLELNRNRKRVLKHRWLMEKHLGRKLTKEEYVHHVDGDKLNNNLVNLVIVNHCQHAAKHKGIIKENQYMIEILLEIKQDGCLSEDILNRTEHIINIHNKQKGLKQ